MKIRINDFARKRLDGIERMDQVGREEKNDEASERKRESRRKNLIYDKKNRKRRQSIIATSSRREWEISATIKKFTFLSSCPSDL